jgi:hypothetical protein
MPASKEAGTRRSRSSPTRERAERSGKRRDERQNERSRRDEPARDEYDDEYEDDGDYDEDDAYDEDPDAEDSVDEDVDEARSSKRRRSSDGERPSKRDRSAERDRSSKQQARSSKSRIGPAKAAQAAMRQIAGLTGKQPEGITAVGPTEDGWAVGVEVIEDRRVPSSADLMAVYEAQIDAEGELMSYQRVRRYSRGRGDDGGGS